MLNIISAALIDIIVMRRTHKMQQMGRPEPSEFG